MANLFQSPNQFAMSAMLAQVTRDPQPNTIPCQLNPSTTATVVTAGCNVKLVGGTGGPSGPQVIVDVCTGPTDGPVFGVIAYNAKRNRYTAGEYFDVVGRLGVLMLKSASAINRGNNVAVTNPSVTTDDPTVASDATSTHYITGVALANATGANQLIPVQISQGLLGANGVITVTP